MKTKRIPFIILPSFWRSPKKQLFTLLLLVAVCPMVLTAQAQTADSVAAWGDNGNGQTTIPVAAQSGVTAIAAGSAHIVAKNDGSVVVWGSNDLDSDLTTVDAAHLGALNLGMSIHAESMIQFEFPLYTVAEEAGSATITVQRAGNLENPASVDYATADGSAISGLKYTAVGGRLSFAAGETERSIAVPILNDGLVGPIKNFRVILSNPDSGALLGNRKSLLVSITDNDRPLTVEFAEYEAREDEAAVIIGVLRGDEGNQIITVHYSTAGVTAIAGKDYSETSGVLSFAPGEKLKLVSVPLLNDAVKESNKTFTFALSNPTGGGVLGAQKTATVTILDNDPGVSFVTTKYFIHENERTLRVRVRRGNDLSLGPFTVDYTTVDGTALAGEDYETERGTLAFAEGEMERSFQVPIINDGILEVDETFQVVLRNTSGGASLGADSKLSVIVCDATGVSPHGFASVRRGLEGVVELSFNGGVSKRFQPYFDLYPLEVSTNLVDWQTLTLLQRTNSATNVLTFIDPVATEEPTRFYRTPTNHFTVHYPKPTGPYSVGRIERVLTDPTRRNRHGISTNGSFAITVWYPGVPKAGQWPAPWFEEVLARDTSATSFWTTDAAQFGVSPQWSDRLPYLFTYSFADAPLAATPGPLPVVLFSHGTTVDRRQDAAKLEALASHGYFVVAMDHFDDYDTAWPNGFFFTRSVDHLVATPEGTADRARDLVFVLDELTNWNRNDAQFAGRLNLERVGAVGMSWGCHNVAELAQQDARCKAVILLDPGPLIGENLQGFSTPSLTLHQPVETEDEVFAASKTNAVWLQISNTDHASFFNYLIFSNQPMASNREAERTINAYTLSFFNKWLKGLEDTLHGGNSKDFPRVINLKKK